MNNTLLEVKQLSVGFHIKKNFVPVLNDINFKVNKRETVCIVGESGCGKSLTSLSIMNLLPQNGVIKNGQIIFDNEDLTIKSKHEMSNIRGNNISMIFQEPMTSLNPVQTVGKQIAESIQLHQGLDKQRAMKKAQEMLDLVGIPSPEERIHDYPYELSGGMRQRVMIAMALSCNPKILIADEPTTALDVTTQAQILDLINRLKIEFDMSIIMITHDLGVVAETADKVIVMYAGEIIEYSDAKTLLKNPKHPYTKGLIASIPNLNDEKDELFTIKGNVPSIGNMPSGCAFSPRCIYAKSDCFVDAPLMLGEKTHQVRCWKHSDKWGKMN